MTIPRLTLEGFESIADRKIVTPSYRAGIHLFPFANDPVFTRRRSDTRYLTWEESTEGSVLQLNWSKRMGQPSASWNAQVKLGRKATLNPMAGDVLDGDWADLWILRNGVPFGLTRGVVDTVRESKTSSGGATVRTLALTGRDHGAMFENIIAWNQIFAQSLSELTQGPMTKAVKHNVGGTPDFVFQLLTEAVFSQGTSQIRSAWALPPSLKSLSGRSTYGQALDIRTEELRGALFNVNLWTTAGQTLHQTLGQWCNPLLNEWRYDVDNAPGKDRIVMTASIRERPFVNTDDGRSSPWFGLTTWTIPDWLVQNSDLGRSGHERFTIFELVADWQFGTPGEQTALAAPIWSAEDVTQYGIRPYLESTIYVAEGAAGRWVNMRREWQRLLADWYAINPYLLSGSITFGCMLPEIQIGSRIVIDTGNPQTSFQGYVEGVDHGFAWAGDGGSGPRTSTTLTVTRGWIGTDADLLQAVDDVSARFVEKF